MLVLPLPVMPWRRMVFWGLVEIDWKAFCWAGVRGVRGMEWVGDGVGLGGLRDFSRPVGRAVWRVMGRGVA